MASSVQSTQIEVENYFFISLKKNSITLETSDLFFRRYNHVMREKSSTKSKNIRTLNREHTTRTPNIRVDQLKRYGYSLDSEK